MIRTKINTKNFLGYSKLTLLANEWDFGVTVYTIILIFNVQRD